MNLFKYARSSPILNIHAANKFISPGTEPLTIFTHCCTRDLLLLWMFWLPTAKCTLYIKRAPTHWESVNRTTCERVSDESISVCICASPTTNTCHCCQSWHTLANFRASPIISFKMHEHDNTLSVHRQSITARHFVKNNPLIPYCILVCSFPLVWPEDWSLLLLCIRQSAGIVYIQQKWEWYKTSSSAI